MLYRIFVTLLLISSVFGENATLVNNNENSKKIQVQDGPTVKENKLPIITNASSSVVLQNSSLSSKENVTIDLFNLNDEFDKPRAKPIHARKGANPLEDMKLDPNSNVTVDLNTLDSESSANVVKSETAVTRPLTDNNALSTKSNKNISEINTSSKVTVEPKTVTKPDVPKKPLKVVYEALANLGTSMGTAKTSANTVILDQMPPPINDPGTGKNPGMITPIVITILVVPMFAVLGYMALRRGQEAWKNRHYKRMDFLLDGMYND